MSGSGAAEERAQGTAGARDGAADVNEEVVTVGGELDRIDGAATLTKLGEELREEGDGRVVVEFQGEEEAAQGGSVMEAQAAQGTHGVGRGDAGVQGEPVDDGGEFLEGDFPHRLLDPAEAAWVLQDNRSHILGVDGDDPQIVFEVGEGGAAGRGADFDQHLTRA